MLLFSRDFKTSLELFTCLKSQKANCAMTQWWLSPEARVRQKRKPKQVSYNSPSLAQKICFCPWLLHNNKSLININDFGSPQEITIPKINLSVVKSDRPSLSHLCSALESKALKDFHSAALNWKFWKQAIRATWHVRLNLFDYFVSSKWFVWRGKRG